MVAVVVAGAAEVVVAVAAPGGRDSERSRRRSDVCVNLLSNTTHNDDCTFHSSLAVLRQLESNTTPIPPSAYLIALDVTALYPSMDINVAIDLAIKRFCTVNKIDTTNGDAISALLQLLDIILRHSYVANTDMHGTTTIYKRRQGITMGIT